MRERSGVSQFRVLYHVFLMRVVDLELLSAHGDTTEMLGQIAGALAAISLLFAAPLILVGSRGLPPQGQWTVEHLMIETTMLVVGLFSVLSWDTAFPDRRDVLILGPLPVRTRTLFWAKMAASLSALGVALGALNVFAGVFWPLLFSPIHSGVIGPVRSVGVYWVTIVAAGLFMYCSVLGLQWVTAQVLPRQMFLRLSALLQLAAIVLMLSVYFLEPSMETTKALTAAGNQWLLACLPSYWFLGLFQQLNGSMQPEFVRLTRYAWEGLGVAVLGAGGAVLLSYLRTLRKIVEEPDILPGSRRLRWSPRLGGGLETAIAMFSLRTLLRSRQHRVLLAFYLGAGVTVVVGYVKWGLARGSVGHGWAGAEVNAPLMAASALMMGFALLGMRIVFSIPIALKANWIFRITQNGTASAYMRALRRAFYLVAFVPVYACLAAAFLALWPVKAAVSHLAMLGLLSAALAELCLYRFRKIPFTCSFLPGKGKLPVMFLGGVVLLVPQANYWAKWERQALENPVEYAVGIALLCVLVVLARWLASASMRSSEALNFEEEPVQEIMGLGLQGSGVLPISRS